MINAVDDTVTSEKILLGLLPFWDPLIPPMGISCLGGFLKKYGYYVKMFDANIESMFSDINKRYIGMLKRCIPPEKRSNFYNIGKDILRSHMMAHINRETKNDYIELVKILIKKSFFHCIEDDWVHKLNEVLDDFYRQLEGFLVSLLGEEKPGILGLSVFRDTVPASLFAFRLAKERYPRIMTVMGGGIFADQLAIGSPDWEFFLDNTTYIDKILIGEGELLFLKLLQKELPISKKVYSLEDIGGETVDISSACIPDFSDFDIQLYPYLPGYSSRSCPYQCNFCSETIEWGKYRKKSPKQVVDELMTLNGKFGTQLFLMCDSLLNPVISELAGELLNSDICLYWDGYLRIDAKVCDPAYTLSWRKAGFYRARLGLESGSAAVLGKMNKKILPEQIVQAVKALAQAGIKTTTYWIVGYPGETEEDFQKTLALIDELKNDIYEAEFNPFEYFARGQVFSDQWSSRSVLLYPEGAKNMLLLQTRVLNTEPSREVIFDRLSRLYDFCHRIGIPNPYSLLDITQADERWAKLHKNAVPPLVKFKDSYLNECRDVKDYFVARDTMSVDGDWNFQ